MNRQQECGKDILNDGYRVLKLLFRSRVEKMNDGWSDKGGHIVRAQWLKVGIGSTCRVRDMSGIGVGAANLLSV